MPVTNAPPGPPASPQDRAPVPQDQAPVPQEHGPEWARRLIACCSRLASAADEEARNRVCEELWVLLASALTHYLEIHARRLGRVSPQECEDIVAQKALDLLQRALVGAWDQSGRSAGEVARFLSTVARNGLLDCLQQQRRLLRLDLDSERDSDEVLAEQARAPFSEQAPDQQLHRKEFAHALRRCAEKLKPRARRIWFFRVFYTMSSKEIASHPDVDLSSNHVDVILLRARKLIVDCMKRKGYEPHDMLPGTFTHLWTLFRLQELRKAGLNHG